MTMLRIGLEQARQTDSLDRNTETILRFIDEAGPKDMQILCFPEGQTAGYRVDITRGGAPVEAATLEALHARGAAEFVSTESIMNATAARSRARPRLE